MKETVSTSKVTHNVVLLIALIATFVPVIFIEAKVLQYTNGIFSYPLDDVFIHMEIAKNLAFHGNWGINSTDFGSASSSPLYTMTLALLFRIFSVNILFPFIVNCLAGVVLLICIQKWLQKHNINNLLQLTILLLVIVFTPLPVLIISGMEHTLQCLFSFLFIAYFSDWVEEMINSKQVRWKLPLRIIVYGMCATSIRYEGLFLIAIACLILLYFKKVFTAFKLGALALLPIIIFGIYSMAMGSYFFPNSVLVKSDGLQSFTLKGIAHYLRSIILDKLTFATNGLSALATQRLLIILPLSYLLFIKYIKQKPAFGFILTMLTFATLAQLSFAATGWFNRYEAYLVFCSVLIVSTIILKNKEEIISGSLKPVRFIVAGLMLFLIFPLVIRGANSFFKAKQACINIYEQQYQMGSFLKQYYNNDVFAANDIGAVSYLTKGQVLDLWGLATIEVARSRKRNYWTPDFLDSLSKQSNAKLAVVYDSWFDSTLLNRWQKVATWQISNNVVCGSDVVSFYAIDKTIAMQLKKNLQDFQQQHLPASVRVQYQ